MWLTFDEHLSHARLGAVCHTRCHDGSLLCNWGDEPSKRLSLGQMSPRSLVAELGFKPRVDPPDLPFAKSFQDVLNSSSSLRGIGTFRGGCPGLWAAGKPCGGERRR